MRGLNSTWLWMANLALLSSSLAGRAVELTVYHEFSGERTNGLETQATMLRATDGALYGTTIRGGANGQGTLFKLVPETKAFQVLRSFSHSPADGREPAGPLSEGNDGFLYGTTSLGGSVGVGTIYKVKKDGTSFNIVSSFTGAGGDGRVPFSGLRQGKDLGWIGTTDEGGMFGSGTIYVIKPGGSRHLVVHHFGGKLRKDGTKPHGPLCQASDGKWYGVTVAGGWEDQGILFVINGDGSGYRVLRAFAGAPHDAAKPFGGLIEATDGLLYGTSVAGGNTLQGTLFRCRKDGSGLELLRMFTGLGTEGRNPYAELLEVKEGVFYGVTLNGGPNGGGLLFRFTGKGSDYETVFTFSDKEGRWPHGGLTLLPDGSLFGTTTSGFGSRGGVVFRVRP